MCQATQSTYFGQSPLRVSQAEHLLLILSPEAH